VAAAKAKPLYVYQGHPGIYFVKFGQYAFQVYKFFTSKHNAEAGLVWLRVHLKTAAPAHVVKTVRGWAVVQLPRAPFRVKSTDKALYKET
jgi:hypothetical protein